MLIAAALVAASTPATADVPDTVASGQWKAMGLTAYPQAANAAHELERSGTNVKAMSYAGIGWAAGLAYGWRDPRTTEWLNKVYADRTPSGGWGSEEAWDPFGDGTVNPANTTYTISTAWHVGLMLVPAYDAGAVPAKWLTDAARTLLNTNEDHGPKGPCISYSLHPNDFGKPCVYNVVAAASWFLATIAERGLEPVGRTAELWDKVHRWTQTLHQAYDPAIGDWPYSSNQPPGTSQGAVYNEVVVEALWTLDPTFAQQTTATHFAKWPTDTLFLLTRDCSYVDQTYPVAAEVAARPVTSPQVGLGKATYAVFPLLIHHACGGTRH